MKRLRILSIIVFVTLRDEMLSRPVRLDHLVELMLENSRIGARPLPSSWGRSPYVDDWPVRAIERSLEQLENAGLVTQNADGWSIAPDGLTPRPRDGFYGEGADAPPVGPIGGRRIGGNDGGGAGV